jgi:hypothetical protein
MRSRVERRRLGEWVLRAALMVLLVVSLWRSLRPADIAPVTRATTVSALASDLDAIVANPAVGTVHLSADALPTRAERDALTALRNTEVAVRWSGSPPAIALEASRVREPDARALVKVIGAGDKLVALVDSAGLLDSVRADAGATIEVVSVVGAVRAKLGGFVARAFAPEAEQRRAVLVLGRADWETKFVMQALNEAGWVVRARIPAAPGVTVHDDALLPLDTARYDVVVALDSSAADLAPVVARFVAQGGGLIAAGTALDVALIQRITPAKAGERRAGRILLAADSVTPHDLPVRPLSLVRSDAVSLQREQPGVTLAARRAGLGRALAIGYDESWRWRMLGGMSGLAAHRRWWSSAAGAVAPAHGAAPKSTGEAAPLASLVSALGPPSAPVASSSRGSRDPLPLVLLLIAAACLLAETGSRRFRGVR